MKKNVGFNEELIEQFNSQEMVMLTGGRLYPTVPIGLIVFIQNLIATGNGYCPETDHQNCGCNS